MELYSNVSYKISRLITRDYSTSFSSSSRLFAAHMQPHIYAIYGLVRIGDEVVDTYRGSDSQKVLAELEKDVYEAIRRGYSTNPVVHSFAKTANKYGIDSKLIEPFFASMAMDIKPAHYTKERYEEYIYGSAEVVGLMCLRVFVEGDKTEYARLEKGARALGSAYQKVNFLRDMAADYEELGRTYFPGIEFNSFDEATKSIIISDIETDFNEAKKAVRQLPVGSRKAVTLSVLYYEALLDRLKKTPSEVIKQKRIRISAAVKARLFVQAKVTRSVT